MREHTRSSSKTQKKNGWCFRKSTLRSVVVGGKKTSSEIARGRKARGPSPDPNNKEQRLQQQFAQEQVSISHENGKTALLARVRLLLFCVVVHFQPRQFTGRNRKWVLDDNLSEAVWRTILRGPRPPSVTWGSNKSSANSPDKKSRNPVPKKSKGKGQSKDAGPPVQSPMVPKPNGNPDEQLKAAQARVVKLEAAIISCDEDPAVARLKEAFAKARAQAQLSKTGSHTHWFSWTRRGRRWRH